MVPIPIKDDGRKTICERIDDVKAELEKHEVGSQEYERLSGYLNGLYFALGVLSEVEREREKEGEIKC